MHATILCSSAFDLNVIQHGFIDSQRQEIRLHNWWTIEANEYIHCMTFALLLPNAKSKQLSNDMNTHGCWYVLIYTILLILICVFPLTMQKRDFEWNVITKICMTAVCTHRNAIWYALWWNILAMNFNVNLKAWLCNLP